ncbi:hypothetical protein LLEC1_02684 [Akanthomyces lecanii]|uniref:Diphthamide biosynthesis protein 4 n=1 Tax=Cordyceps confragosa TaxID=2714763 RepID=A0A179I9E2_CORDF|nr:hypothetical protein LLEC1_02684 [Akanthomyces lecanii]
METPSAGRPSRTATHYEILDLQPALLGAADPHDAATLIKRAYRRALLRNHPDKSAAASSSSAHKPPASTLFTVDQISGAYAVLSSPQKRQEYDASLRMARIAGGEEDADAKFQTGIENVDLDDLEFDEAGQRWYRSCRCGNDRGYSFEEEDLVEASDDGVLMVGCHDCSLWLKVHFAVVEDE